MHRQSLGSSPSPKHDEHLTSETAKQSPPPPPSSTAEETKKLMRHKHTRITPETYIHLIPMLTLLCFLILYLSSHRPSPIDLAEFKLPNGFSNPAEMVKKGDNTLAIRSLKNMEQEQEPSGRAKHRLLHRKIAGV